MEDGRHCRPKNKGRFASRTGASWCQPSGQQRPGKPPNFFLPPDQRLSARSAGSQHASSASLAASAATRPYQRGRTNSPGLTYPRALTCVQHTNHATRATSIVVYLPDSTLRCSCHSALPVIPCPLLQLGDPRAWGPGTRHRRPRRRLPCPPCSLILIF